MAKFIKLEYDNYKLTGREEDIMNIFWHSEKGLIASAVVEKKEGLTINTVQATLKKLFKRNLLKIDEIVYSGTVLSRSYVPVISKQEFEFQRAVKKVMELKELGMAPKEFVERLGSYVDLEA